MLFGLGMSITRLRAVRHRDFLNQSLLYGNRAFLIKPNDDVQAYMGCLRVAALNIIIAFMGNIGSECIIPGSVHIQPVQTGAKAACQFVDRYSCSFGHFRRGNIFCSILPYESHNVAAANAGYVGDVKH
mgnify:CR=1 FL=1